MEVCAEIKVSYEELDFNSHKCIQLEFLFATFLQSHGQFLENLSECYANAEAEKPLKL